MEKEDLLRKGCSYLSRRPDIVPTRSIFLRMYKERTKSFLYTSFCVERAKRVSKATVLYNVGKTKEESVFSFEKDKDYGV